MTDRRFTRRTALKGLGALAAGTAVSATASANETWDTIETPLDGTLYDVVRTADGPYAVGAAGTILERTANGWETVVQGGPTGNGNTLYGAGTTYFGERLWVVGSSGAIGEYNVRTGNFNDYSAPNDVTNNFNDVAVTGMADYANVYVAGDSGKIYSSFDNGATGTWDSVTPGSGSAINAIDFHGSRSGHAVDGNKTVFTTDDGSTYDQLGIENANVNFHGVDSDGADDVTVSGGGGVVYTWNGSEWRTADTGDATLRDIETEGDAGLTVGGGGKVYRYDGQWVQESTPTGQNLKSVVRGSTDIAVGAAGAVIEY
ncbi:hypothetical protein ACFQL1_02955 [Halomicroarcula sp. GCM10025709]|uniref:hypothetical protein n=1 Tax=Haloarcula TaxID=2237 RepID=UPI0024C3C67D|nr:hypothetical protein [Halomicroarcula sp. YJ-61-S]